MLYDSKIVIFVEFSSIFNIIIVRTEKRFYQQPIGKLLALTLTADSL
jgi:hypothetical protein